MREKISLEDFTYRVEDEKIIKKIVEENCPKLKDKILQN